MTSPKCDTPLETLEIEPAGGWQQVRAPVLEKVGGSVHPSGEPRRLGRLKQPRGLQLGDLGEPARALEGTGGRSERTAFARSATGRVQGLARILVGAGCSLRQVPCSVILVLGTNQDVRQRAVGRAPLRRPGGVVDRRSRQRMAELDQAAASSHQAPRELRLLDGIQPDPTSKRRPSDGVDLRRLCGRGDHQRQASALGDIVRAPQELAFESGCHRQRHAVRHIFELLPLAGELSQSQWIAGCRAKHPVSQLRRERSARRALQKGHSGGLIEPGELKLRQSSLQQRRALLLPQRDQHRYRVGEQAAGGKGQSLG